MWSPILSGHGWGGGNAGCFFFSLIPALYESLKKEGADFSDPDVGVRVCVFLSVLLTACLSLPACTSCLSRVCSFESWAHNFLSFNNSRRYLYPILLT